MQQDNNHIDKKLRDLESQSLPDLSKIDVHWKQMQTFLTPAAKPASFIKGKFWMIAATVIAVATISFFANTSGKKETELLSMQSTSSKPGVYRDTVPRKKIARSADTIYKYDNERTVTTKARKAYNTNVDSVNSTIILDSIGPRRLYAPVKTRKPSSATDTVFFKTPSKKATRKVRLKARTSDGKDTVLEATIIESASTEKLNRDDLNDFFTSLQDQPQSFLINNRKDTIIFADKGTALLIPANSFNSNQPVTILVKEFYSYQDIIANRLSTTSNNEQLVTGGMIHITAMADGKEINIKPGKSIRWFIPHKENMENMQLFTGINKARQKDKIVVEDDYGFVDWSPMERSFTSNYSYKSMKVLDLRNEPYKVRTASKGDVGFFVIAKDAVISKTEAAKELKEKYGYRKVKVKTQRDGFLTGSNSLFFTQKQRASEQIGDSAWVDEKTAYNYNLKVGQTKTSNSNVTYYINNIAQQTSGPDMGMLLDKVSGRYGVDINTLGWINCDRFYNSPQKKVPQFFDLNDSAFNYYTVLVFDKQKSIISGQVTNKNQVVFTQMPLGESATFICVGIKNNKIVSSMQPFTISNQVISITHFDETTPKDFKKQVGKLDE